MRRTHLPLPAWVHAIYLIVSTSTVVESFNGYMRRVVTGVFHSASVTHLGRYTSEATFR